MRRRMLIFLALGSLVPAPLAAQRPVMIGIAGGVSVPEGKFDDGANTGWHALGTIVVGSPMLPMGLRVDIAYNRFELAGGGHGNVISGTLNGTYRIPLTDSPFSPYLISGLGAYRTDCSLDIGCGASTRYGWNVGLGTKLVFAGFRGFLEARYHRTERGDADVNFFPVTLGLTI